MLFSQPLFLFLVLLFSISFLCSLGMEYCYYFYLVQSGVLVVVLRPAKVF